MTGGTNFDVDGHNIVIVGGTAGIGLGVASHLSSAGANVVITGRRDASALAAEIGAISVVMDIADGDSVTAGFAHIAQHVDHIDCLILNAGIDRFHGTVDDLDLETFETVLDVNTMGIVRAMAAGIASMRSGGSVVVTSSPAGSTTLPGIAAYSASKAALDMLVRTWALELGPAGIRVNAVLPGIVESEMDGESTGATEMLRRLTATGIVRQPAEMGPIYQFLASAASIPVTGSLLGAHDGVPAGLSAEVMDRVGADLAEDDQ